MKKEKVMTMIGRAQRQEAAVVSLRQQLLHHDDRKALLLPPLLLLLLPVLTGLQQQGCLMPHYAIALF